MGYLFVEDGLVDNSITAIDSTLLKAKGPVWHKSSMKKVVVPCPGIDTDGRWGYSYTKGWTFGYKLHLTSTTGKIVVPLTADVTTANMQDNQMYVPLTSSSFSAFSLPLTCYMVADPGYDDKNLYEYSKKILGIDWFVLLKDMKALPKRGLRLYAFINRILGQTTYSKRRISIEPLIEHIKSVFRIDPLPVREFNLYLQFYFYLFYYIN